MSCFLLILCSLCRSDTVAYLFWCGDYCISPQGRFCSSRFPCCVLSYFSLAFFMEHNWQIQVIRVSWVGQSTSSEEYQKDVLPARLEICQNIYTTGFSDQKILHTKSAYIMTIFTPQKQHRYINLVAFLLEFNWVCRFLAASVQNHTWCG